MTQSNDALALLKTVTAGLAVVAKIVREGAATDAEKAAIDQVLNDLQKAADPVTGGLLGIKD